ncbi:MAG: hypothetical protein DRQ78_01320 [Epsilonproteobacteria bacterium]|nr:MAG: hypothetical protein DRQ78_01320 [Campylobacterota bacterium]
MISKVESDSNAIGYTTAVSIFDIEGIDGTIEDGIKVLAFDDILPTRVNIDNGAYPISTLFSSFLRVENDDFENMQTSIINGDK